MRVTKTTAKAGSRKAVSKAIAKQDAESKQTVADAQLNSEQIQDAIRLKAYELYTQRGYQSGSDIDDWLAAEQMVLSNAVAN